MHFYFIEIKISTCFAIVIILSRIHYPYYVDTHKKKKHHLPWMLMHGLLVQSYRFDRIVTRVGGQTKRWTMNHREVNLSCKLVASQKSALCSFRWLDMTYGKMWLCETGKASGLNYSSEYCSVKYILLLLDTEQGTASI